MKNIIYYSLMMISATTYILNNHHKHKILIYKSYIKYRIIDIIYLNLINDYIFLLKNNFNIYNPC